jgi:transcriptional regulator with XRE-family HTH domain
VGEPGEDRQHLAAALRDLRSRAKLSTYQLGQVLGWSQGKVSKMERGQTSADPDDVAAWARATGASPAYAVELATLATAVADQMESWRARQSRGLAATRRQLAVIHQAMTGYREFAPNVVPDLLQTQAYAARVLELVGASRRSEAEERMRRQVMLLEPSVRFRFVVTEAVLRVSLGSPNVMREQAAKILAMVRLPNVSLAVLSATSDAVALQPSGFMIYDVPGEPVVLLELLTQEIQLRAPRDVQVYEEAFALLEGSALVGKEAIEVVETIIK